MVSRCIDILRVLSALALILVLAACGGTTGDGQPAVQKGTLAVTVTGLPDGVAAAVQVTGPGGFSQLVTASTVLADLAVGSYQVVAGDVQDGDDSWNATVTGSPALVTAGGTATVTVNHVLVEVNEPPPPPVGTLQVNISGLPPGSDANVNVTGPTGFDQNLTQSSTLSDLAVGDYEVTASQVELEGETYHPQVSGSPATVAEGATATVTVTYALLDTEVDTGSLQLNITGLPEAVEADVTVTGPDGFSVIVTASSLIENLPIGSYQVSAATVTPQATAYVGQVDDPAPEVLKDQTTTVNVTYAVEPLTDDGDSEIKPAVFVHFNPSGTQPYSFDGPLFNEEVIRARGMQYNNTVGDPGDPLDHLRFTQQPGDNTTRTLQLDLDCVVAEGSDAGVRVTVHSQDDENMMPQLNCGDSRTLTIPANSATYWYRVTIEESGTAPTLVKYSLSINSHCFQSCEFIPYEP